jgi:hypothetical protein
MKLRIINLPTHTVERVSAAVMDSRQRGTYLAVHRSGLPPFNLWIIGAGILFGLLLSVANQWSVYYWYVAIGTFLVYFIVKQFQKLWRWWRFGKDAVFFDPLYFISISGDELQALPLSHFTDTDIIPAMSGKHYLARFHFQETSILIPCFSQHDENVLRFQDNLKQYYDAVKQAAVDQGTLQMPPQSMAERIARRRTPLISAAFALLIFWFVIPNVIDRNQYLAAKEKNTATAYRTYLAEPRNLSYREVARTDIRRLYDLAIQKYRITASGSAGADAFAQVVEFLRDKNLYTVQILFYPESELFDLPPSTRYRIIPVTASFSPEKNQARQDQVISTVKASLGQIFPTDILTIASEESAELPRLEVYYTYRNNPERIYYPVKEEHLPERSRTWYYGIEIDWWFRISLPTRSDPIYSFNLVSQPAHLFESESFEADAVYTNMALSAFNDFRAEFHKQFLNQ